MVLSCSSEPKIVIDKNHITNSYWNNYNNSIQVFKMKVKKDSIINTNAPNFKDNNGWNLFHKLEIDSTFYFGYNGLNLKKDKPLLKGKIHFDKDNGFDWYTADGKKSVIGSLENNSWYLFNGLTTNPFSIIVYIDENGVLNRFNKIASNY